MSETEDRCCALDLIEKIKYLLEWMPICSVGSSGHMRRVAVEEAMTKLESRINRFA